MVKKGWIDVPVKKLRKAKWNYKVEDDKEAEFKLIEQLINNIKKNGQIENLIIRPVGSGYYEVVNGNHRLEVFKRLKFTHAHCFNLGKISDAQAKRIAVETNETKFQADNVKLAKIVKNISDEFSVEDLCTTFPWPKEEIEGFTKMLNFDWGQYDKKDEESESESAGSGGEGDNFRTLSFALPLAVAEQLEQQIDRFKMLLYPDKKLDDVSYVSPIEAICQHLAQTSDNRLV